MSSQQPFNTAQRDPIGEVQHIHYLSEHIGALFLNDEYSDVTLVVEHHRFHAHKVILAARSEYFRALLYGGMKESQLEEIELKDTHLLAFKELLRYIYRGHMTLGNQKDELILEILGLAHKYGFQDLESSISDYLKAVLSIKNVCLIYDTASLYGLEKLMHSCCFFMDRHAVEVIQHESFGNLSRDCVREIISRDSFCAPEVEIFKAVYNWVRINDITNDECENILKEVRLTLIPTQDLLKVVRPTNLVQPDVLLDAIQSRTESRDMELKYRGYLIPEENVATTKHGATVILGEAKQALLDGDTTNYDMERGFTRHPIDDSNDKGIVIKLGMQCIVNHLRMLLWDKDCRSYSYYVDVSMDQKDWVRVIDYTKYLCRSWQELYFTPRVVKYIRIVGTFNTLNKVFHLVSLEAYYTKKPCQFDKNGILIPKENVATIERSASVQDGVSRSRHALLNGDTSNYDWDSGYTCHQLGSGSICVQLGQPYAIESMKLLLWDCDDRSYSYYIEVSNNKSDWEVVWDRSKQGCKSWQHITFPRRPLVLIRIVGTHNTANEVFHCVHFESPAVTNVPKAKSPEEPDSKDQDAEEEENGNDGNAEEEAGVEAAPGNTDQQGLQGYEEAMVGMNDAKDDAFSHVSIHSSPSSNAGSVSAGQSGMPMGASACSMARASSSGGLRESLRQSSLQINSPSSSPVLFEATNPAASSLGGQQQGISRSIATASTSAGVTNNFPAPARHGGSAPSLPGSVVQSVNNSPARAASVDEAASLALANLLEIDETQSNSGGQSANNTTTTTSATTTASASANNAATARRYQHALSVRVPPNQHGTTAPPSGAIPRRQSRSSVRSQNQSDEN